MTRVSSFHYSTTRTARRLQRCCTTSCACGLHQVHRRCLNVAFTPVLNQFVHEDSVQNGQAAIFGCFLFLCSYDGGQMHIMWWAIYFNVILFSVFPCRIALELQGGRFDHADRLFFSIPNCWELASATGTACVHPHEYRTQWRVLASVAYLHESSKGSQDKKIIFTACICE